MRMRENFGREKLDALPTKTHHYHDIVHLARDVLVVAMRRREHHVLGDEGSAAEMATVGGLDGDRVGVASFGHLRKGKKGEEVKGSESSKRRHEKISRAHTGDRVHTRVQLALTSEPPMILVSGLQNSRRSKSNSGRRNRLRSRA